MLSDKELVAGVHAMRWIGLVILFGGMTACAPWVDDAHHRMIHDAQEKLGSLEEGFKWDRREIIDLRKRIGVLEKRVESETCT